MPLAEHIAKLIAPVFHIPRDTIDYYLAAQHIGRGAETALPFPAELIPMGARMALRGFMNDAFFSTNRDWILPYWAERQFDPQDLAFHPRGFDLYTVNYARRDWTMVGNQGSDREAVVDPRGLVTPWFDGWSLDVWIEIDGTLFAPSRMPDEQVSQSLNENLPVVSTTWRAGELVVRTVAYATAELDAEWVVEEITVENAPGTQRAATLYVSVRPFNPEGVSLIKQLEYRESETDAAFLVNDAVGIWLPRPDAAACSEFGSGDIALRLQNFPEEKRTQDPAGLGTAAAKYQINLNSGERRTWALRMPLRRLERDDEAPVFPAPAFKKASAARTDAVSGWREALARGMRVRLPDDKLQNAFDANKAFLLLLHDGDSITPGPWTYHQFWFRDSAYLLNALDKLGYHDQARQVIEKFPRRLEKDGYLRATEGEWDSNGAAIWAMVEHARLSGDWELIARHYWSLLRMASWINSKRDHRAAGDGEGRGPLTAGLLPSGPSAEHLGPADYYYWDDFWGLAGLREAADAATRLGATRDAERLSANLSAFSKAVNASLAATAARNGRPAMPASPFRRLDAGMVGNLVASYPLRIFEPDDPRIIDTLSALKEQAYVQGAYFNHVGHAAYGTYLALHIAECLLFRRDPEAWDVIRWILDHASSTYTWAEGLHPLTLRGGMGDGHHGWAIADFLIAVRNLILLEEKDHLVITPVLPDDWTAENSIIKIEDAPTYFGKVSATIAFGERAGTLVLDGEWHTPPAYIEWNLPHPLRDGGGDVEGVEIIGRAVRLPQGARRVVVMW